MEAKYNQASSHWGYLIMSMKVEANIDSITNVVISFIAKKSMDGPSESCPNSNPKHKGF